MLRFRSQSRCAAGGGAAPPFSLKGTPREEDERQPGTDGGHSGRSKSIVLYNSYLTEILRCGNSYAALQLTSDSYCPKNQR
jgi:hypothetical protein